MNRVLAISLLGALVAGGGMSRYQSARQRARIVELRRDLAAHAARVDQSIAAVQEIDAVLQQVREESKHRIAWVQVRDENGVVRGHAGMRASATFPLEFARAQLRNRRPVFAVTQTEAGPVLLEVFAVRLPAKPSRARYFTVSNVTERFGVIEIAAHIDGGITVPVERQPVTSHAARVNFL